MAVVVSYFNLVQVIINKDLEDSPVDLADTVTAAAVAVQEEEDLEALVIPLKWANVELLEVGGMILISVC